LLLLLSRTHVFIFYVQKEPVLSVVSKSLLLHHDKVTRKRALSMPKCQWNPCFLEREIPTNQPSPPRRRLRPNRRRRMYKTLHPRLPHPRGRRQRHRRHSLFPHPLLPAQLPHLPGCYPPWRVERVSPPGPGPRPARKGARHTRHGWHRPEHGPENEGFWDERAVSQSEATR
jgi:hypothetical protein